jgi:Ca-activated chloride channel family protein
MTFLWPIVLLSLLVLPALLGGYLWQLRRRRRLAVTHSSVALIRAARPARSAWRRHVPIALLLAALASLGLAGARPQVRTAVPVTGSAVILALDVSGSMCATDVDPNRLTAAQNAVRDFVHAQDPSTRIGLVLFSGFAQLAVPPTTGRTDLLHAIDSLTTGQGTMIGAAILKSVDAISQIDPNVKPADGGAGVGGSAGIGSGGGTGGSNGTGAGPSSPSAPGPAATVAPEIVVLLTDGANTGGVTPLDAAKVAAARGVRVYPIGFGTANPTSMVCTADQLGGRFDNSMPGGGFGGGFGGNPGSGRRNFLVADDAALRQVATTTGGAYFSASGAKQLQSVLADLPRHVDVQHRDLEVTVGLAGLSAVLVLGSVWAAWRWSVLPS